MWALAGQWERVGMSRWVEVPAEVAAAHGLHGMRGWLRLFSIWIALAAIGGAVLGVQDVRALLDAAPAHGPDAALEAAINLGTSVVQLALAVLWFRAWRHFRLAFLGVATAATLAAICFNLWEWWRLAGGPSDALADQVASDVLGTAALGVLLAYMQVSRRFRVTFENRVRRDDPVVGRVAERPPTPPSARSHAPPPARSC
jgi:hypothetical protein